MNQQQLKLQLILAVSMFVLGFTIGGVIVKRTLENTFVRHNSPALLEIQDHLREDRHAILQIQRDQR